MKNKVLCILLGIILLTISTFLYDFTYASTYDYTLTSYDVDIKVNEDNTFDITEKISAFFNVKKHGIYRKIPITNTVKRLDGTTSKNRAKIKNIEVNDKFTTSLSSGYRQIKIGDEDITYTGEKDYLISYNYNIGKDKLEEKDELYFNIIGTEWDTSIKNPTFKITMPKDFDTTKIGFSSGKYGSTDNSNIIYSVNENVITGEYIGTLKAGEGITIRIELPEGYFSYDINKFDNIIYYLLLFIPIILVIITYILWYKYGKDKKVVKTVEFYPPDNLNSLDLAYAYKGNIESKDITSLLIYLANKGYLSISEAEKKSDFVLTKLKDYDGDNKSEQKFLKGLFKNKDVVTKKDLENKFYTTINEIKLDIKDKKNKEKIFEKNSLNKKLIIILFIVITFICSLIKPLYEYGFEFREIIIAITFPLIFIIVAGIMAFQEKLSFPAVFIAIIFFLASGTTSLFGFIFPAIMLESRYIFSFIIGIICIIIQFIFFKLILKRTEYGINILGRILGFKEFLKKCEKNKLEELVLKEPKYFYNILPYTYVLGISNKWIKKFESISVEPPDWYSGSSAFDMVTFSSFMNSTINNATSSMTSSPSSSGSSGGGFSGGGSGGGGGGSW